MVDSTVRRNERTSISSHANRAVSYRSLEENDSMLHWPNLPIAPGFLSDVPVAVKATSVEKPADSKNIWYVLEVEHGEHKWTLHKKLSDLNHLQSRLKMFKAYLLIPTRSNIENRRRITDAREVPESIPGMFLTNAREFESRLKTKDQVEKYLNYILSIQAYKDHAATRDFFELSPFSFKEELGLKMKEGFLQKRSGWQWLNWIIDKIFPKGWKHVRTYQTKWFILKESLLMCLDKTKKNIVNVMLFDKEFEVKFQEDRKRTLRVSNGAFEMDLKCPSEYQAKLWKIAIEDAVNIYADSVQRNMNFDSFAPARNAAAHWFVDGRGYFSAVADALENAKEEIYMTDWFLSPFIALKREDSYNERWEIVSILKRKADMGVKVYVMLYKELKLVMDLGSSYAKRALQAQNYKNIRVLRHPQLAIDTDTFFWSHHEKLVIVDQKVAFVSGLDLSLGRWDYYKHPLVDIAEYNKTAETQSKQYWIGKDYTNYYKANPTELDRPFEDQFDRRSVVRMPWHDVGAVTYNDAARDVARHFIQRWNYLKATKYKYDETVKSLLPKSSSDHDETPKNLIHPNAAQANVQVLRSVSDWSVGLKKTEQSIQNAYIDAIENSEHYIYLENQFFISCRNNEKIENRIVDALYRRILRAWKEKEVFRVYVVMPLIPGTVGDFSEENLSETIQVLAHYQYLSISRGEGSLIGSLLEHMTTDEISEYVGFYALRSKDELLGKPVTEVLYVHSKLLIVDDCLTIVGSANINDRSLVGDRDSEVVLYIQDREMIPSTLNGMSCKVGKFAYNLRKRVFDEHLGLLPEEFLEEECGLHQCSDDIVAADFYHGVWRETARSNTQIFTEVFRPIPADEVRRFSQVDAFKNLKLTDDVEIREKLSKVQGHLVQFPLEYLSEEDLDPEIFSKIGIVPADIFT